ncbi:MAG: glycosyltransferase family 4 protein [bacterium]|nr:glycosyltransferase family 4 protein [bacterium]
MRAAIYNPYLDTLGGGERYIMTVAHALKRAGWDVDVQWSNPKILEWLELRLGLDLSGIEVVADISRGAGYDLLFWLSDGSVPLMLAKNNILHFQTPFQKVRGRTLFNRLKLAKINNIVCNSQFTKGFIDEEYGVKSQVIYPPVAVAEIKPSKKEDTILFVGRFSQLQQSKRQDILIDIFKRLYKKNLRDWKLVLIGGSDVGRSDYVDYLKKEGRGYPVEILENLPFSEVKDFYGRARIFWSASGYGVDALEEPQKVEHFGISVVEAMAAKCVPIVINQGGHREIVDNMKDGFLWDSFDELEKITLDLVSNERSREKIAQKAQEKAKLFSQERFEKEILELLN